MKFIDFFSGVGGSRMGWNLQATSVLVTVSLTSMQKQAIAQCIPSQISNENTCLPYR